MKVTFIKRLRKDILNSINKRDHNYIILCVCVLHKIYIEIVHCSNKLKSFISPFFLCLVSFRFRFQQKKFKLIAKSNS